MGIGEGVRRIDGFGDEGVELTALVDCLGRGGEGN